MKIVALISALTTNVLAAPLGPKSLHGHIALQSTHNSGKPIRQCFVVPSGDGDLNVRAVAHDDGVSFFTNKGKSGRKIALAPGTVSMEAIARESVLSISMRPAHGEKSEPLGPGQYLVVDTDGKKLLAIPETNDLTLSPSPKGDYAITRRQSEVGDSGDYGSPAIYKEGDTISLSDYPPRTNFTPAAFSSDGERIAVLLDDRTIILDRNGKKLWKISARGAVYFFAGDKQLAFAASNKLTVFTSSGEKVLELSVPGLTENSTFKSSSDSKKLLIGSAGDGKIHLIDLASKKILWSQSVAAAESVKALGKEISASLMSIDATPELNLIAADIKTWGFVITKLTGWGDITEAKDPAPLKSYTVLYSHEGKIIDELGRPTENISAPMRISANGKRLLLCTQAGILDFSLTMKNE